MISDWVATIFTVILVAIGLFIIWSVKMRHLPLIHKLYLGIAVSFGVWLAALLCMKYTDPANTAMLWVWDSLTYIGVAFLRLSPCALRWCSPKAGRECGLWAGQLCWCLS